MHPGRILGAVLSLAAFASCDRRAPKTVTSAGCLPDLRLLLGACVSPVLASRACGAAAIPTLDGCAARAPCEPGRARDLQTGECLSRRDTRTLATTLGIVVAEDEILSCPSAANLLVTGASFEASEGSRIGCLPAQTGASRRVCPVGTLLETGEACVPFAEGGGRIDVVRWLHGVIGPHGGPGAPPLCNVLGQSPGALANPGPSEVVIEIEVVFPDNDVTQVSATVRGSGAAPLELEQVLAPMFEALRSFGGIASQGTIASTVHCRRASERPAALAADRTKGDPGEAPPK